MKSRLSECIFVSLFMLNSSEVADSNIWLLMIPRFYTDVRKQPVTWK